MRVICSWCGKIIVPGPDEYVEVSHGICEDCCKSELDKIKEMRRVNNERL